MKDSWDILIENIVSMMDEYGEPIEIEADLPDLSELATALTLTVETMANAQFTDVHAILAVTTSYIRTAYTMGLKRGELNNLKEE